MNWKSIAIALALSAAGQLNAQRAGAPLAGPPVGVVHCPDGSLRTIYGLPANLMFGGLLGRGVNAAAFSSTAGLILRAGQIEYLAANGASLGTYVTDESTPLLAVSSTASTDSASSAAALAWLPSSHSLVVWRGSTATQVEAPDLPGQVIALSLSAEGAANLMVATDSGSVEQLTVSLATGQITETLTVEGATGSAYAQNGFLLLPGADGLLVRFPDGHQRVLGIKTAAVQFEPISDEWVHLSTPKSAADSGSHWLLHLDKAATGDVALQLSELPAAPVRVPKVMPRQVGNLTTKVAQ